MRNMVVGSQGHVKGGSKIENLIMVGIVAGMLVDDPSRDT